MIKEKNITMGECEASFIIRSATGNDAHEIAPLIYDAIGDLALFFTGSHSADEAIKRLESCIESEFTRFSYRYAYVVEKTGPYSQVVAVGSAYDASLESALTQATINLSEQRGWPIRSEVKDRLLKERESLEDTFYIDHVAVNNSWQGLRLGTKLVQALCKRGFSEGFCAISLLADKENPEAQRLYARLGFSFVGQVEANGHVYNALKLTQIT